MLQKIGFQPGINKQISETTAEGQWVDCDNVRFRYGSPEKIGGWNQLGNQNEGVHKTQDYVPSNSPGVKVELKPGDMLIYSGCDLEHWREPFEGNNNAQVFLHYNNKSEPNARAQKFDTRMHLGLPSWFKGKTKEDFK